MRLSEHFRRAPARAQLDLIPPPRTVPAPPSELALECARFRAWYASAQAGSVEPYRYAPSPALLAEIALLCARPARRAAR